MIQIDIDMPKRCEECPLCVDYDCIIHERITDEYYDTLAEQYAHCPLNVPSAQPEVIRCKDCWHYPGEYSDCPMIGWARNENDYCSKAEGRHNE